MRPFGLYQYSCLLWFLNVVLVILSYFVGGLIYSVVVLFPAVFVSFGLMIILRQKEQIQFAQIWKHSTLRSKIIALISIIYTIINFIICMLLLSEGGPHIDNGVYCIWNHGFVREITKAEYEALMKVEGRFYLGHILTFSALPVVFFSARKRIKK